MAEALPVLLILVLLAFGVGMTVWTFARSRELLNRWANDNGYEIVSSEFRWLRRGPFFWTSSKGQMIYHVVVRTEDGETKRGWVRCGGFWWGLLQDRTEAKWETWRRRTASHAGCLLEENGRRMGQVGTQRRVQSLRTIWKRGREWEPMPRRAWAWAKPTPSMAWAQRTKEQIVEADCVQSVNSA